MSSTTEAPTRARLTLLDRVSARRNGLRDPRPYVPSTVRIPMRDGVELGASLFTPVATSKGVVVLHGPYGRGAVFAANSARIFAAQGYTALLVSTRGTADSGGELDPMRTDAPDGHDTVAWMREQPWYEGRFATAGASYLGFTQWALLAEPEPDHVAAVVTCGPYDFATHPWVSGTSRLEQVPWTDSIVMQRRYGPLRAALAMVGAQRRVRSILDTVPLSETAVQRLGRNAPWLRDRLRISDVSNPYWTPMRHRAALDRTTIPVLVQAGWQDIFLDQSLEEYVRLHERGQDVALTVGPWAHLDLVGGAARVLVPEMVAWLDRHLAGDTAAPAPPAPVRVYVTGADVVRLLPAWPPETTRDTLHCGPGGLLSASPTPADAPEVSFRYDPYDPTPTVGGPMLSGGGYVDDSSLAERPDVLAWTGAALEDDLTVMGAPQVELAHSSERPDADVFVRLSDVDAQGRSRNVTERLVRVGFHADGPVRLELRSTAHTFRRGHRLRVLVAGGSFPQYARNPGTGENPLVAAILHPNRHTVRVAGGASSIILPVV
jgi:putative CocE/NonD family hydrolase